MYVVFASQRKEKILKRENKSKEKRKKKRKEKREERKGKSCE